MGEWFARMLDFIILRKSEKFSVVSTYFTFLDHSVMQPMLIVALCKVARLARVVLRLIKRLRCLETEAKPLEDFAKRLQSYTEWSNEEITMKLRISESCGLNRLSLIFMKWSNYYLI